MKACLVRSVCYSRISLLTSYVIAAGTLSIVIACGIPDKFFRGRFDAATTAAFGTWETNLDYSNSPKYALSVVFFMGGNDHWSPLLASY